MNTRSELLAQKKKNGLAYFEIWKQFNREHQVSAYDKIQHSDCGSVIIPTGCGKTRIQTQIIIEDMVSNPNSGVYVIAAHRLLLCKQLIDEIIDVGFHCGLDLDILFVGSTGSYNEDDVYEQYYASLRIDKHSCQITNTTTEKGILDAVAYAKKNNRHILCVSTYHSFERLSKLDSIDICTYDEAHITTREDFAKNIFTTRPIIKKNYFFTATKTGDENFETGMFDEKIYGDPLVEISPKEMIDKGEVVQPKILWIKPIGSDDYENTSMMVSSIIYGFNQHKIDVKNLSCSPNLIGAKLLITCGGTDEMMELHNNKDYRTYCSENNIKVFVYSSMTGYFVDFKPVKKMDAFNLMRSLKDTECAMLLHVDILTEGIDLPSITGVMPFRQLSITRITQTVGRAMRLQRDDRINFYAGKISPADRTKYIKPYCWILFPEAYLSRKYDYMRKQIEEIYTVYDIPIEPYSFQDKGNSEGETETPRITEPDVPGTKDKVSPLEHFYEDIFMNRHFGRCKSVKDILDTLDSLAGEISC